MNIHRRHALRLALYLSCVQISSQLSGHSYRDDEAILTRQFQSLSIEILREARRTGRKLIREANGLEAATLHLVPAPRPTLTNQAKWQRRCARYLNRMQSCRLKRLRARNAGYSACFRNDPGLAANSRRLFGSGRMTHTLRFMSVQFNPVSGILAIHRVTRMSNPRTRPPAFSGAPQINHRKERNIGIHCKR